MRADTTAPCDIACVAAKDAASFPVTAKRGRAPGALAPWQPPHRATRTGKTSPKVTVGSGSTGTGSTGPGSTGPGSPPPASGSPGPSPASGALTTTPASEVTATPGAPAPPDAPAAAPAEPPEPAVTAPPAAPPCPAEPPAPALPAAPALPPLAGGLAIPPSGSSSEHATPPATHTAQSTIFKSVQERMKANSPKIRRETERAECRRTGNLNLLHPSFRTRALAINGKDHMVGDFRCSAPPRDVPKWLINRGCASQTSHLLKRLPITGRIQSCDNAHWSRYRRKAGRAKTAP